MGLMDDVLKGMLKGNVVSGIAVGLGIMIAGSVLVPLASRSARPAVKGLIRGGLKLYGLGKEKTVGLREAMAGLVAEAKDEGKAGPEGLSCGPVAEPPV